MKYALSMPTRLSLISLFGLMFGSFAMMPEAHAQSGEALYQTYCAGCHGAQLDGNSASPLIKMDWQYGKGRNHLVRNITYGIEGTEMAAWRSVLTSNQINALASYIEEAQDAPLTARQPIPPTIETDDYTLNVEVVIEEGLESPWSIVFLDERRALVSEVKGQLRIIEDSSLHPEAIRGTPVPLQNPFGGYMGLVLDPDFQENGWIYLAMAHTTGDPYDRSEPAMTRVIRGRIQDHTWVDQEVLFQVPDSLQVAGGNRWGGRLLFDDAGYLYFTIGDLAQADASQDPARAPGKTYRIHADGAIPSDNPFVGVPGALEAIYTLGNRNTQGLTQHPDTGDIWSTDHGPMGGDELNILVNGANHGWPLATHGIDYNGDIVSELTDAEGIMPPVIYWTPSIAACPATFVSSSSLSAWEGDLLVGALAYEELRRVVIEGRRVVQQEIILKGYGRVRDIHLGPDDALYVILNRPDKIVRLTAE